MSALTTSERYIHGNQGPPGDQEVSSSCDYLPFDALQSSWLWPGALCGTGPSVLVSANTVNQM